MKGKRIVALILTSTVLFSQLAYAESRTTSVTKMPENYEEKRSLTEEDVTIKEIEALEIANDFLERLSFNPIEDYRVEIKGEIYRSPSKTAWSFEWDMPVLNGFNSYILYVDAETGQVLKLSQHGQSRMMESSDYDLVDINIHKMTHEKGLETANKYLKLINPKKFEDVKLIDNNGEALSYQYNTIVNGLMDPYRQINIRLDSETGLLEHYSINWFDDLEYDDLDEISTIEEARDVYARDLEMDFTYIGISNEDYELIDAKPAYKSSIGYSTIRAHGLEPIIPDEINRQDYDGEFTISENQIMTNNKISSSEAESGVTKKVIRDQAEAYLNIINDEYTVESCEEWYSHNGNREWYVPFEKFKGDWSGGSFRFNLFGKLKRYSFHSDEIELAESGSEQKDFEQLKEKAIEVFSTMFFEELKKADYTVQWEGRLWDQNGKEYPNLEYLFSIVPTNLENSYRAGIQLEIGSYSGQISRIENDWIDVELVDEKQIISPEKAKEAYLSHIKVSLEYSRVDEESNRVEPVYRFSSNIRNYVYLNSIDAITGEPLDYSGQVIKIEEEEATNHWAKETYDLLKEQMIIDEDDNNDLDRLATMYDVIHIMVNAKGNDYYRLRGWDEDIKFNGIDENDPSYDELCLAIAHNIIVNEEKEWNWDATVTKEEMVVYIIRAVGLEKVAQFPEIYKDVFEDSEEVNSEYKGYIALAKGLGYITGDTDGKFYPKKEMTYGELVHLIYTLLANN